VKVLVTGAAGFIGYHLAKRLAREGHEVVGLDNINDYYSTDLKYDRLADLGLSRVSIQPGALAQSSLYPDLQFVRMDLEQEEAMNELYRTQQFEVVYHLAAQAGVRYSLENPGVYVDSNVKGFLSVLEACRHYPVKHLIFASSSSVYGLNTTQPYAVTHPVDHPISLYAATKKANELMAHTYSHLFRIPATGLRFFTVYGPWGRPDMAYYSFARAIQNDEPVPVYNQGENERDFTYVDDIVESLYRLMDKHPEPLPEMPENDPSRSTAPYRLFNIGNSSPVKVNIFVETLENALGKTARKHFVPGQPGDVLSTYADVKDLEEYVQFRPDTPLEAGIGQFAAWFKSYHRFIV
jgi:UDP-glucuronate 4-epimerase